jgi:hypothetical protein
VSAGTAEFGDGGVAPPTQGGVEGPVRGGKSSGAGIPGDVGAALLAEGEARAPVALSASRCNYASSSPSASCPPQKVYQPRVSTICRAGNSSVVRFETPFLQELALHRLWTHSFVALRPREGVVLLHMKEHADKGTDTGAAPGSQCFRLGLALVQRRKRALRDGRNEVAV